MVIAVIADIVGSRQLHDRAQAQRAIEQVITQVEDDFPLARESLAATVGDELQGVYDNLGEAMASLLAIQLRLPENVALRFGLGIGEIREVASAGGSLSDGPGWYAARDAIETIDVRERTAPRMRTWIVGAPGQNAVMTSEIAVSNAYLLVRDELVGAMSDRERRLAYGRALGASQEQLATSEGIQQPSISKSLRRSGAAALLDGMALLQGEER